ncbi:head-tail adaptor protein [Blastococcus sp. CT_GayMR16]|uniref:phage head completion protein n=1 Tax=Blastococcus sp. CT_GayMR16 TaxID=2559607 RepID=UPI001431F95B|nr:head-tail adaptor protein [Blastococcus sp. CT_GayMR16]
MVRGDAAQRRFRSRAVLSRKARVSDGQGGWTDQYSPTATDVACRRRPVGDRDAEIAEQLQAIVAHVVYFAPDQDVRRGDQVAVDGYLLLVEAVTHPSAPGYLSAACSEIQKGT